MLSNGEAASLLRTLAELMMLHGEDDRASKSFSVAAFQMSGLTRNVVEMDKGELQKIFNSRVVSKIEEIKATSAIQMLDELIQLTPSGIFEMMRIKGLGGKKLAVLWKHAGIDHMDMLLKACRNNEVAQIKGFGEKTQQNIIKAIEYYKSNAGRFHFATIEDEADKITELLRRIFKTEKISLCGDVRRKCNIVERIEIVCALTEKQFNAEKPALGFLIIEASSTAGIKGHTLNEIPFIIYLIPDPDFYFELFLRTGNEAHTKKMIGRIKQRSKSCQSEQDIYTAAGMPYIIPELRENVAEWKFTTQKKLDSLVAAKDIRGLVHNHTTWSDGIDTLKNFVIAAKEKGFDYVVISDHSKNAHYAGGLSEEKIIRQHEEIESLSSKLAPFKIFKSIESDILISGDLDYSNDFLKRFDLVIISVHQLLKMDEEKATRRLLKAIENPYTTILGHMTGRKLLIRNGYPVNYKKIIDACAANHVVIEINANPYRLDIDWSQIPYAIKKGVMISVNPDAHSIGEIENIYYGVVSARKGGLTRDMTWNAMPLSEIEKWLKERRVMKGLD